MKTLLAALLVFCTQVVIAKNNSFTDADVQRAVIGVFRKGDYKVATTPPTPNAPKMTIESGGKWSTVYFDAQGQQDYTLSGTYEIKSAHMRQITTTDSRDPKAPPNESIYLLDSLFGRDEPLSDIVFYTQTRPTSGPLVPWYREVKPTPEFEELDRGEARDHVLNYSLRRDRDGKRCIRWVSNPSISLFNEFGAPVESVFNEALKQVNDALVPSGFQMAAGPPNDKAAQIHFVFCTRGDFYKTLRQYDLKPFGNQQVGTWVWWNEAYEITKVVCIMSIEQGSTQIAIDTANHVLLQAIGIDNTWTGNILWPRNPFYSKFLTFFYLHTKPGDERAAVLKAFDEHWKD